MACCGADRIFNERLATRELKRFRRRGPGRTTKRLLAALRTEGATGATLLDIGGGVGAIHHLLLDAGVERAVHVDAAPAYLAAARDEAQRRGHGGRMTFIEGDFTAVSVTLEPADIVTLDRVICCYPNVQALVSGSAAKSKRYYAATYPLDHWGSRMFVRTTNLMFKLTKNPFRTFVHRPLFIEDLVRSQGFRLRRVQDGLVWRTVVFERVSEAA